MGRTLKATPVLTPFLEKVRRAIRSIPRGHTMSYGGVAELCGVPQGARAVVRALRSLDDVPWWRVRRSDGSFAPQCLPLQRELLLQEGWKPPVKKKRKTKHVSAAVKSRQQRKHAAIAARKKR